MRSAANVSSLCLLLSLSLSSGCLGYIEEGEVPDKFLPKAEVKKPDAKKAHAKKAHAKKHPAGDGAAAGDDGDDGDDLEGDDTDQPEAAPAVAEAAPVVPAEPVVAAAARGEHKRERTAPKTVVLIVLESVRADHMSLCGYDRPTTPYLDKFVEQRDGAWGCGAYAPATTSVAVDVSMMSGLLPDAHRVFTDRQGVDASVPLLAEHFDAEGYQTALVAGNPALAKATGLWRGFDEAVVAPAPGWRGEVMSNKVRGTLSKLNADRPLFLVVEVHDAAAPYPAVGKGAGWAPPQAGFDPAADDLAGRLASGALSGAERGAVVGRMIDSYDAGVLEADRNVGRIAGLLRDGGWLDQGARIVVTSNHGEHLGDHDLVGDDGPPWESMVRVPVVFRDNSMDAQPALPVALSTAGLYWLVKEGRIADGYAPAVSFGRTAKGPPDAVAVWDGAGAKLMRLGDATLRFDVGHDPGETHPLSGSSRGALATRLSDTSGKLSRQR